MNKTLTYILPLVLLCFISSCRLEEPFVTEQETSEGATIEFVARPTVYDEFNVSTKVTSTEITDLENKIYTAFFMLFDNNGNRVVFKDLTENISSNTVPSQTITPDNGLSNATACFLANVPTAYATSLTTVNDLKGNKPLTLTYESITARCIGIPVLTDADKEISEVYSIPMAGVIACNLSNLEGDTEPVIIPLERLFAKVIVNMSVNLTNPTTRPSNFTLSNYVVKNIPTKVAIMAPENDPLSTLWSASTTSTDYLTQNNVLTNFNHNVGTDDDNMIVNGNTKSFFFYAPEHMVPRDKENEYGSEVRQNYKPTLFNQDSPKKPLILTINGGIVDENGNDGVVQYDIYLGENEYDDFNIKRNKQYNNTITINGTGDFDHRVELTQGDITVSFKRASHLDSHFEVRPLRIQWTGTNEDGTPKDPSGTVSIEVLNASDGSDIPTWVRLERPENPDNATYCGSAEAKNIGKRRYFTTDLINELSASTKITYQIDSDSDGNAPTWVYVDEYVSLTDDVFTDDARQAKIRVQYTPEGASTASHTIDYVITQRSVYPIVTDRQDEFLGQGYGDYYVHGIEFFEEYLYNYDDPNIQDSDGFIYDDSQNGIPWGLEGITLSRNNKAMFITESSPAVDSDRSHDSVEGAANLVLDVIGPIWDNIMTTKVQSLPFYYDYYIEDDRDNVTGGDLSLQLDLNTRDYKGYEMNVEILHHLLSITDEEKILLNGTSLDITDTRSVMAYCYNKNKRDINGDIIKINSDGSLDLSNYHWYAPSTKELEEIIISAYNIEDEFDVFASNYYWSCQPSYSINQVEVKFEGKANWKHSGSDHLLYITADAYGPYFQDDVDRARSTRYAEGNPIYSSVSGVQNILKIGGTTLDYGTTTRYASWSSLISWGYYTAWLTKQVADPNKQWNPTIGSPEATGNTITYQEGNKERSEILRVRCVYNPNPPTKATRTANDSGGYDYEYTE